VRRVCRPGRGPSAAKSTTNEILEHASRTASAFSNGALSNRPLARRAACPDHRLVKSSCPFDPLSHEWLQAQPLRTGDARMRQRILKSPPAREVASATDRLVLTSRYCDCLRRLSRAADPVRHADLGAKLMEVACCMDRMSDDIATSDNGIEALRRAARLIGIVECLVDRETRASVLH
jgi:hypothetical protein